MMTALLMLLLTEGFPVILIPDLQGVLLGDQPNHYLAEALRPGQASVIMVAFADPRTRARTQNDLAEAIELGEPDTINAALKAALSPEELALVQAVRQGDPQAVKAALTPKLRDSPQGQQLMDLASAFRALDAAKTKLDQEKLTVADVYRLGLTVFEATRKLPKTPEQRQALASTIAELTGGMVANIKVADMLKTMREGDHPVPLGSDVPIGLVPGLPPGAIVPLGNGAVLVGPAIDLFGEEDAPQKRLWPLKDNSLPLVLFGSGNVLLAAGYPVGLGEALPEVQGRPITACLLLTNAATDAVSYSLNQQQFTMKNGETQTLPVGETWIIEFDRGGNFGVARYTLANENYKFAQTERGWELYKKTIKVTLENPDESDFNYALNHNTRSLSAGQSQAFESSCPLLIRFDDSTGQTKQKRLESGKYLVALGADNTLDLFPEEAVTRPTPVAMSVKTSQANSEKLTAEQELAQATSRVKWLPPGFKLHNPYVSTTATSQRTGTGQ